MELKPADVFITHDPKDSAKVEPWVIVLGAGGVGVWYDREPGEDGKVKLSASRALERSRLVVFFLSSASLDSEAAFQELMLARQMKKPIIVISLEAVEVADGWRSLLREAPMIDIRQDGRREAWQSMLQVLGERKIKWLDPDDYRPASRINVRRTQHRKRRLVTAVVLFWVVVLLAYFGFIRPRTPMVTAVPPSDPELVAIPPPVVAPVPGDSPVKPQVKDEPRLTPSLEFMKPMDARQAKAVEHVTESIKSANRDQGLDAENIERVLSYFADPAYIQDKGRQDRNGLKAYMKVRQVEWPRWLELVESIDVSGYDGDGVLVSVRSSYLAENAEQQNPITGVLNTRYTVTFSADGQPAILRVEGASEQAQ